MGGGEKGFISSTMIDRNTLATWSRAPDGAERYLRPFICRGPLQLGGAAIVGLNPATPIGPADIEFSRYLDLLLDLTSFTAFYEELRVRRGKRRSSPTRTGLNGIARWLSELGCSSIVDTNVSPFPTGSKEDLSRIPPEWQSRWVFEALMRAITPRLVILHGEDALNDFTTSIAPHLTPTAGLSFLALVNSSPQLGQVAWSGGDVVDVFVCPHLRFFGHHGGPRYASLSNALQQWKKANY